MLSPTLEGGTQKQAVNPSLLFTQEGPTECHSGSDTTAGRGNERVRKWRNQQVKSWLLRAFGLHKQIKLTLLGNSWTNKQNELILKVQGAFWLTSWPREDSGCLLERGALVQSAGECPKKTVSLDKRQIVKGKGGTSRDRRELGLHLQTDGLHSCKGWLATRWEPLLM